MLELAFDQGQDVLTFVADPDHVGERLDHVDELRATVFVEVDKYRAEEHDRGLAGGRANNEVKGPSARRRAGLPEGEDAVALQIWELWRAS